MCEDGWFRTKCPESCAALEKQAVEEEVGAKPGMAEAAAQQAMRAADAAKKASAANVEVDVQRAVRTGEQRCAHVDLNAPNTLLQTGSRPCTVQPDDNHVAFKTGGPDNALQLASRFPIAVPDQVRTPQIVVTAIESGVQQAINVDGLVSTSSGIASVFLPMQSFSVGSYTLHGAYTLPNGTKVEGRPAMFHVADQAAELAVFVPNQKYSFRFTKRCDAADSATWCTKFDSKDIHKWIAIKSRSGEGRVWIDGKIVDWRERNKELLLDPRQLDAGPHLLQVLVLKDGEDVALLPTTAPTVSEAAPDMKNYHHGIMVEPVAAAAAAAAALAKMAPAAAAAALAEMDPAAAAATLAEMAPAEAATALTAMNPASAAAARAAMDADADINRNIKLLPAQLKGKVKLVYIKSFVVHESTRLWWHKLQPLINEPVLVNPPPGVLLKQGRKKWTQRSGLQQGGYMPGGGITNCTDVVNITLSDSVTSRYKNWTDEALYEATPTLRLGVQPAMRPVSRWLPLGVGARRVNEASSVHELVYSGSGASAINLTWHLCRGCHEQYVAKVHSDAYAWTPNGVVFSKGAVFPRTQYVEKSGDTESDHFAVYSRDGLYVPPWEYRTGHLKCLAVLGFTYASHYAHFTTETVPRLVMLLEHIRDRPECLKTLHDETMQP